ncbi:hypothetical protein DYB36_012709 [Aphanomyces astaci]|uniref:DDE-1 domain-containing protein n=1 Tax=Aphanomyces astaci TaxID=112090 RepID=A0A397B140_APHAT|nr:hypothetical protein DYB36_012709 [Aphanomyces astaci]
MSIREIGDHLGVHYSNVRNWLRVANKLSDFKGNKKSSNIPGAGRPPILPEPDALLVFMDSRRHQERALTCSHMVNYLKKHQNEWLQTYIARQADGCGYDNLLRLLQRFCARHGYTYQQDSTAKRTITDLESTRAEFAARFHKAHGGLPDDCVYNVDETGIQYDMPPRYNWSKMGGTPKLSKGEKHSYRMTAVLTIRRDGSRSSSSSRASLAVALTPRSFRRILLDTSTQCNQKPGWTQKSGDSTSGECWPNASHDVRFLSLTTSTPMSAKKDWPPLQHQGPVWRSHRRQMAPFKRHLRDLWIAEDIIDHDEDWMSPAAHIKRTTMIKRTIMVWEKITPEKVRASFLKDP